MEILIQLDLEVVNKCIELTFDPEFNEMIFTALVSQRNYVHIRYVASSIKPREVRI